MKIFGWWLNIFLCACVFGEPAPSQKSEQASDSAKGFTLLDKVCVVVEGEEPVLLSEITRRADQRGESFAVAQKELVRERLLWVYAKKQLKYDITNVFKATDEHINNVMTKNRLTNKQFEDVLMNPPYRTTFRQFRLETATEYLKNSVRQTLASQIAVTDDQVKSEMGKRFDVVFITIQPKRSPAKGASARAVLSDEIKKANTIRGKIQPTTTVNDIKNLYGKDKDISIVGPIAYETDILKKDYDERLKSESSSSVIGPFEDDGSVTMIWKIKKSKKNLDETALEKLKKESYHNAVLEKFNAITDSLINSSTVIEKSCGKR
jgi:hypothetical protein